MQTSSQSAADSAVDDSRESAEAIPLPEIADRAEELDQLVEQISSQLLPKTELSELENQANLSQQDIVGRSQRTKELLAGGAAASLELEDEQRYWQSKADQFSSQRNELTARAATLLQQIHLLEVQELEWQRTWNQVRNVRGIEALTDRTRQQMEKAESTRSQAQLQLNSVLTLQNKVSQENQQSTELLASVRRTRQRDRSRIFNPDGGPLWQVSRTNQFRLSDHAGKTLFERSLTGAVDFIRNHKLSTLGLMLTYVLMTTMVLFLLRHMSVATASNVSAEEVEILEAPYSIALVLTLLVASEYITQAPTSIAFLFYLFFAIPLLRLRELITQHSLRLFIYAAVCFYILEALYLQVQLPFFASRIVYFVLIGFAITILVKLSWSAHVHGLFKQRRWSLAIWLCAWLDLGVLIAALLGNVFGYFSLSQLLGTAALVGPFMAISLYCAARVLISIANVGLDSSRLTAAFHIFVNPAKWWIHHIVVAVAIGIWLKSMLQLLAVYEGLTGTVSQFLKRPIGFGKFYFTLSSTLDIVIVMIGGYALAKVAILLLQHFVLPRIPLQRGLPYAISKIMYYIFLSIVAFVAMSAAGVELDRFTVLTGAMGVGLGFGLQNIVNNFVSGIILLCERPIHIGDTVEIAGLIGVVRRIGARSSTVLTFQGAEVIVPNSNLLSDQVVNWTLSSQLRRVDIKLGVAYDTDPEKVIRLLVDVAKAHPGVLTERPPAAFFMGFGESALNFELRFWCSQHDMWLQLQSEVTVAVAKALREAAIEIPFPQRDLHLHGVGFEGRAPGASVGALWRNLLNRPGPPP